jgi:hypothetical protein
MVTAPRHPTLRWGPGTIHHAGVTPAADPVRRRCPSALEAQQLARRLLHGDPDRIAHVLHAGQVAARVAVLFDDPDEAALVVAAATLHDIGYAPALHRRGFHPLDGALHLREAGYPDLLVRLVANHSQARLHAGEHRAELERDFPEAPAHLADALSYADLHSAPDGSPIEVADRLADITRRHPEPAEQQRAEALLGIVARVEAALRIRERAAAKATGRRADRRWRDFQRVDVAGAPTEHLRAWQEAEESYRAELATRQAPTKDWAIRLAQVRSRADRERDAYFRSTLP